MQDKEEYLATQLSIIKQATMEHLEVSRNLDIRMKEMELKLNSLNNELRDLSVAMNNMFNMLDSLDNKIDNSCFNAAVVGDIW